MEVKIYYHDTDAGGVVYYANYLKFLEEARTEFFAQRGIFIKELASQGVLLVVVRQEIDYKSPAFYGDILSVSCDIQEMDAARIQFMHQIRNQDNKIISLAKTTMVCVDNHFKPRPLPNKLKNTLLKDIKAK